MNTNSGWFTPSELAGLRGFVELGFITDVTIRRRTVGSNDYGDDSITYPIVAQVKGWLYHKTPEPTQTLDINVVVTTSTFRLTVPIGTDIAPGDWVDIGGEQYTVGDTTREQTWNVWVIASLRKRD